MLSLLRVLLITILTTVFVQADTVTLASGEVIIGKVLEESETHLTLQSTLLGEISIEKSKIQSHIKPKPLNPEALAKPEPKSPAPAKEIAKAEPKPEPDAEPKAKPEPEPEPAKEAEPVALSPKEQRKAKRLERKDRPKNWSGEIAASLRHKDTERENNSSKRIVDEVHSNVSGKLKLTLPKSQFDWNARYRYKTVDRGDTRGRFTDDDNYSFSQAYKRDLRKSLFLESFTTYRRNIDLFQIIEYRQSLGIGWEFINKPKLKMDLTTFGGWQWLEDQDGLTDDRFTPSFTHKTQYKPTKTFTVSQNFEFVGFGDEYSTKLRLSAEQQFIGNIFLRLRYERFFDDYTREIATIEQTITELVYKFKF